MLHTVRVRGRRVRVDPASAVAGTSGADEVALDLDAEWDGLAVRVALSRGEDRWEAAWEGEPVAVPAEALEAPGVWLAVSVVGEAPGRRLATYACRRGMWVQGGGA